MRKALINLAVKRNLNAIWRSWRSTSVGLVSSDFIALVML
jgi:hypothetical protein